MRHEIPYLKRSAMWDALCNMDGTDLHGVLVRALNAYWAKRLADTTHRACAALRADPTALATYEREKSAWQVTLLDGLEDE